MTYSDIRVGIQKRLQELLFPAFQVRFFNSDGDSHLSEIVF